jgi:hypothetical protein
MIEFDVKVKRPLIIKTRNDLGLTAAYSNAVFAGKEVAFEFVKTHETEIRNLYPEAYDDFILNIKTRYLNEYIKDINELIDAGLKITERSNFYTSYSAIIYNLISNHNGTLDNTPELVKFEQYLLDNLTRFSFMYFLESRSMQISKAGNDTEQIEQLKEMLDKIVDKVLSKITEDEKYAFLLYFKDFRAGMFNPPLASAIILNHIADRIL